MTVERELAPGEWSVLALLAEEPGHGWALARQMARDGEIGRVWALGRPLVYRALELLEERGLIEPAGSERGIRSRRHRSNRVAAHDANCRETQRRLAQRPARFLRLGRLARITLR